MVGTVFFFFFFFLGGGGRGFVKGIPLENLSTRSFAEIFSNKTCGYVGWYRFVFFFFFFFWGGGNI